MKLNVKGFAVTCGIMWVISVAYIFIMAILGKAAVPFEFVNQMYFGLLSPTIGGMVFGIVLAFVDAFIFGAIFAWLYNKFVKPAQ